MKQYAFFPFITLCTIPFLISAQNVGIGTTSPQYTFDVRTPESGTVMRLRTAKDSVGATTLLRFTTAANLVALGDKSSYIGNLTSGAGHNLVFGTSANNQAMLEKMRLNYQGFLGLGTTDPTARLYIDMSNTTDDNALVINDDEDALVELRRSDIGLGFWQLFGNDVKIGTTLNNNLGNMYIRTNGADRVVVTPTGVVRMGNLNGNYLYFFDNRIQAFNNGPTTEMNLQQNGGKLEVGSINDAAAITKLQVNNGVDAGLPNASSGYLMLGLSNGTNLVADINEIQARNNGASSTLYLQNSGGNLYIGDDAPLMANPARLGVNGNAFLTGNLQIGTRATPAGYKLSVDGKVICTEVLVKSSAWPDYVFSDNYPLMPISLLDRFIRKNKHLPGISVAKQIEKGGLSLGEMQRLQMEKIEELTLYVIQLKKEMDQLKKRR
jgi:hypothetical protein